MTFDEYQSFAKQGIVPETTKREPIIAFALGLAGEAGEVVDDIKKRIYHGRDIPIQHTVEELGDVMWYVANIATTMNISLDDVINTNIAKLKKRYQALYTEAIPGYGMYQGKRVAFMRSGPHIKMYDPDTNTFIKFLNKEEKKYYGFTESGCACGTKCSTETSSDGCEDVPWD